MQKNFVRTPGCALEAAIRSASERHPGRDVWNWTPDALSVCRYSAPGVVYKAVMPDLDWSSELELMGMLPWQRQQYRHQQRRARA